MDFSVNQDNGTAIVQVNVERLNASNASGLKSELVLIVTLRFRIVKIFPTVWYT